MNMSYVAVLFGVAALADAAHALNPTQTMDSATIKLFVATGESLELITGIRAICDPSTEGQYSNVPDHRQWGPAYSAAWEDLKAIERLFAWSCRIRADAPNAYSALRGRNLTIFFSRERGLDGAYFDAVANYDGLSRAPMRFLSPSNTTCTAAPTTAGVVPLYWCSGTQLQRPLMGVAEVDASLIQGLNVTNDPNTYSPKSGYPSYSAVRSNGPMKVYGVAASLPLYRAMQGAQALPTMDGAANRPTASSTDVRSLLSGSTSDWGWLVGVNHPRRHEQINWCLPREGSGVRAVAQRVFLEYPCNGQTLSPVNNGWSDQQQVAQLDSIGTAGMYGVVDDADTERGVEECMATATARGAMALGFLSVGRFAETASLPYRVLKLDGIEPHRDQAKTGRYPFVGESIVLWHEDQLKNSSTALQQLVAGYPALLNTPWVWGDSSGVMLQPNGTFGTGDTADQRMRAASSRSGLMCQPVTHIANLPDAAAANNVAPLSKQRSATAAAAAAVATATQQEQPPQLLKMPPLLSAPTQQP